MSGDDDDDKKFYERESESVKTILTSDNLFRNDNLVRRRHTKETTGQIGQTKDENIEEKNKLYKREVLQGLQKTIYTYIAKKTDRDKDYIGPVEIKSVITYVIIVLVAGLIFFGLLFILTFLQLIVPLFSFSSSLTIVFILFIISQIVFYILFFLLLYVGIINYVVLLIYLGIVSAILFISSNSLQPFSIIASNVIIGGSNGFIILIVFLTRTQLEQIKRFSPIFDMSSFLWTVLCLMRLFTFIEANRGFLLYIFFPYYFNILFQFASEVVELFRGISGPYKGLKSIEGILVICNLLYAQFFVLFFVFYIIKFYGIIVFVFWPPWFYTFPASWFTWL